LLSLGIIPEQRTQVEIFVAFVYGVGTRFRGLLLPRIGWTLVEQFLVTRFEDTRALMLTIQSALFLVY
jgi:hypothetical protein